MGRGFLVSALAVFGVTLAAAVWLYLFDDATRGQLLLAEVQGDVFRVEGDDRTPGRRGMVFELGQQLVTGEDGRAVIRRGDATRLQVEPATTLAITGITETEVEVELTRGEVRAKIRPSGGALRVRRGDRSALATDASFRAAADANGGFALEVEQGQLALSGVVGAGELGAGERLYAGPNGQAAVSAQGMYPLLHVAWPEAPVPERYRLRGRTGPGTLVKVILAPGVEIEAQADLKGEFEMTLPIPAGDNRVEVHTRDPFGRTEQAQGLLSRKGDAPLFELTIDYGKP